MNKLNRGGYYTFVQMLGILYLLNLCSWMGLLVGFKWGNGFLEVSSFIWIPGVCFLMPTVNGLNDSDSLSFLNFLYRYVLFLDSVL